MTSSTIDLLQRCEFLRDLDDAALALLAAPAVERWTEAGAVLFRRGEPRSAFFVVLEGQVEVLVSDGTNTHETVVLLGPGDAVGESGLLEPGIHSASAQSPLSAHLLEVPLGPVRELSLIHI